MSITAQQVRRVTCAGAWQKVEFEDVAARKFFVKNFSSGDIYVSFSPDVTDTSRCIKIPSMMGEEVYISEGSGLYFTGVWVSGAGEVEVEATDWRRVQA